MKAVPNVSSGGPSHDDTARAAGTTGQGPGLGRSPRPPADRPERYRHVRRQLRGGRREVDGACRRVEEGLYLRAERGRDPAGTARGPLDRRASLIGVPSEAVHPAAGGVAGVRGRIVALGGRASQAGAFRFYAARAGRRDHPRTSVHRRAIPPATQSGRGIATSTSAGSRPRSGRASPPPAHGPR